MGKFEFSRNVIINMKLDLHVNSRKSLKKKPRICKCRFRFVVYEIIIQRQVNSVCQSMVL